MNTFAAFRTQLITGAIATAVMLSGYIWTGHVSAEDERHKEVTRELKELRDVIIRLDAYIANQQELNAWFVSEHQRRNRTPDR